MSAAPLRFERPRRGAFLLTLCRVAFGRVRSGGSPVAALGGSDSRSSFTDNLYDSWRFSSLKELREYFLPQFLVKLAVRGALALRLFHALHIVFKLVQRIEGFCLGAATVRHLANDFAEIVQRDAL